jgi:hypothetical protein
MYCAGAFFSTGSAAAVTLSGHQLFPSELLFCDCVAGFHQPADPPARLGHPVISNEEASTLVHGFRAQLARSCSKCRRTSRNSIVTEQYRLEHRDGEVFPRE